MKKFNFYRNEQSNCKTVLNALRSCDNIMYCERKNTVLFFKGEGLILEANCKDKMDFRQLAANFNIRYAKSHVE